MSVTKSSRSKELSEKAQRQQRRCRDWLLRFMQDNQPTFLTKDELRSAAMRELNVSNNSFDFAWIDAIETSGRVDWYEPLRKRTRTKNSARSNESRYLAADELSADAWACSMLACQA